MYNGGFQLFEMVSMKHTLKLYIAKIGGGNMSIPTLSKAMNELGIEHKFINDTILAPYAPSGEKKFVAIKFGEQVFVNSSKDYPSSSDLIYHIFDETNKIISRENLKSLQIEYHKHQVSWHSKQLEKLLS